VVSWPSWDQAAIACLLSVAAWVFVRGRRPSRIGDAVLPAFHEFALITGLYSIWRLARQLPFTHEAGAIHRARQIERLHHSLHLPSEISMQHFVLHHDRLARLTNAYYATLHVPALIAFLVWMFIRHRDRYAHWRNGLVAVTAGCLVIRFVRVAPPRFIHDLGFVDLSDRFGLGVYGPVGSGVSDQFAAMPSIHVGWAAVVSLGVYASTTSRWRWVCLLHLPITVFVVAATGHHWWLDGVVAIAILLGGLAIDTSVRRRRTAVEDEPPPPEPREGSVPIAG
jgi:hypothetical protein